MSINSHRRRSSEIVYRKNESLPDTHEWHKLEAIVSGLPLSPELMLEAFRKGLFPWGIYEGRSWWCPKKRGVLLLDEFHVSRSLRKRLRSNKFEFTRDKAFSTTIDSCQAKHGDDWLDDELVQCMKDLHNLNASHSVEVWNNENLVGGVYGTEVADIFIADSMFSHQTDASKVALYYLVQHLKECGFQMIDCQALNPHTISLGGRNLMREQYLDVLDRSLLRHPQHLWQS